MSDLLIHVSLLTTPKQHIGFQGRTDFSDLDVTLNKALNQCHLSINTFITILTINTADQHVPKNKVTNGCLAF